MSSLREISANVGAFTTIQCVNLESGNLSSNAVFCTNLVSDNVTSNTIECTTLVASGDVSADTLRCTTLVSTGNISADTVDIATKTTTNQFRLIPSVPSLGYTLTSDITGNATWTAPPPNYPSYKQTTGKISVNGSPPALVVSSDGTMIVVPYPNNATDVEFKTYLYTGGAWVLDSTITTSFTNNQGIQICLSEQNDLLGITSIVLNQVAVYRRTAGVWNQVGTTFVAGAGFGSSLVINGATQTLVVAHVLQIDFYSIGTSTITPLGDFNLATLSRHSLAISADFRTLVAGNTQTPNTVGEVLVYTRAASDPLAVWSLVQTLVPYSVSSSDVLMGESVSLSSDGSTLAVGCPGDALNAPSAVTTTGAVLIYTYVSGVGFVQGQKIIPVDYTFGANQVINFGLSLQLNFAGDKLVIGGPDDQDQRGSTWVYVRGARGLWVENADKLRGSDLGLTPYQGSSVALARGNASVVAAAAASENAVVIFQ